MPSPSRPPSMRALRLQTPHMAAEVSAADLSEDDDSDSDACMAAMESMRELEPEQAPRTRRGSSANQGAALGATSSSGANQGPALGAAGAGAGGDRLEGQARSQRGQAWGPIQACSGVPGWHLYWLGGDVRQTSR